MNYTFDEDQLDRLENILIKEFIKVGVHCVLVIDVAGNIIARGDNGHYNHDVYSLAALAAGSFGAVNALAEVVGEEEFSLLFHKGQNVSIHFSKISENFLILTVFGDEISLGLLRLKGAEAINKIREILERK
ncbi:Gliding motility protein [Candidatus Magnetomoraceae bacterium gMMP-15]